MAQPVAVEYLGPAEEEERRKRAPVAVEYLGPVAGQGEKRFEEIQKLLGPPTTVAARELRAFGRAKPSRPLAGAPPQIDVTEETAAELGGIEKPPFGTDPVTALPFLLGGAVGGLPVLGARALLPRAVSQFTTVPTLGRLWGAPGARMIEQIGRGAGTIGAMEAMSAGEEGGLGAVPGGFVRGATIGAAFGPALGRSTTLARGIIRPLAIGGGVGLVMEGPEGIIPGALTFGGLKAGVRGVELAGKGLGALGKLFRRRVQPEAGADAPSGLAEEVFTDRLALPEPRRRLPGAEDIIMEVSPEGVAQVAARRPPTVDLTEAMEVKPSLFAALQRILQNRSQPTAAPRGGPPLLPEPRRRLPAPEGMIFEVPPGGLPQAARSRGLTPEERGWLEVLESQKALSKVLTPEERATLEQFLDNPVMPREIKDAVRRVLEQPQRVVPGPKPVPSAKPPLLTPEQLKSFGSLGQRPLKQRKVVPAEEMRLQAYVRKYLKGINSGDLKTQFEEAVGKQRFKYLSSKGTAYDEAAEILHQAGYLEEASSNALEDALRRDASGKPVYSRLGKKVLGEEAIDMDLGVSLAAIERNTNQSELLDIIYNSNEDIRVVRAAAARLKELGVNVRVEPLPEQIAPEQLTGEMRDVLAGNFGKKAAYSKGEIETGQRFLNLAREQGKLKAEGQIGTAAVPDISLTREAAPSVIVLQRNSPSMRLLAGTRLPVVRTRFDLKPDAYEVQLPSGETRIVVAGERSGMTIERSLVGEPPRFEPTQAGMQGVLAETPQRQVPTGALKPKRAQTEALTPLEEAERVKAEGEADFFEPKPIMAVRLKNGQVISDPDARNHYNLVVRNNLNPDDVIDTGFVRGGKYEGPTRPPPDWAIEGARERGYDLTPGGPMTAFEPKVKEPTEIYARRTPTTVQSVDDVAVGDIVWDKLTERYGHVTAKGKDVLRLQEGKDRWTAGVGNRLVKAEVMGEGVRGSREIQMGMPLESTLAPEQRQAILSSPAEKLPRQLTELSEGDLSGLIREARSQGKGEQLTMLEKEFSDRMQGPRPANPDPLDDLSRAEREGTLLNFLDKKLKDQGGFAMIGRDPNSNSLSQDMNEFFNRHKNVVRSWGNLEFQRAVNWAIRRTDSAQELARHHPEFDPIYQPFHGYSRQAINRNVEAITPLFRQSDTLGNRITTYFDLPDASRQAVDRIALLHKANRQGLPRYTPEELRARGFNEDQIRGFGDMLGYGRAIIQAHWDWYVESRLPALVASGMSEGAARAQLDAQAQKALHGMDHWVPHFRRGDKTITVKDELGRTIHFEMVPSIAQRVERLNALRTQYPGRTVEEGVLEEFVKTKAFDEIDLASLEILSRFAGVDATVTETFINQLRPTLLERSDALARFKHFENIPGFKEDLREGLMSAGDAAFHYIERQRAYRTATEALRQINARQQPELFKFAQQYIEDNMQRGDRMLAAIRDATYAYVLGGNLKQFVVQLMQLPQVVFPRMLKFGSLGQVTDAAQLGMKWAFSDLKTGPREYQTAWREAYRQGTFQARAEMFTGDTLERLPFPEAEIERRMTDMLLGFRSPAVRNLKKARDFWMLPVTDADMRSRLAAFTGFYKLGRETQNLGMEEAINFAVKETNRTGYLYGKAENPQLFGRGPWAQFLNMFKTWPTNYVAFLRGVYRDAHRDAVRELGPQAGRNEILREMAKSADAKTLGGSLSALLALGGALYNIPTAARAGYSAVFGSDPESDMRELLSGKMQLPEPAVEATLRGLPALAGVDLSRSLALGDVFPVRGWSDILGPTPASIENIATGAGQLAQSAIQPFGPEVIDALELMAGGGLKNAIRGARLWTEGVRTKRGGLLPGNQPSPLEAAEQVAGFTPISVSRARALQRAEQGELSLRRYTQSRALEDYARAVASGDSAALDNVLGRIDRHNDWALGNDRIDQLITIDQGALRQRIAEMLSSEARLKRVPKVARERTMERETTFQGPPTFPQEKPSLLSNFLSPREAGAEVIPQDPITAKLVDEVINSRTRAGATLRMAMDLPDVTRVTGTAAAYEKRVLPFLERLFPEEKGNSVRMQQRLRGAYQILLGMHNVETDETILNPKKGLTPSTLSHELGHFLVNKLNFASRLANFGISEETFSDYLGGREGLKAEPTLRQLTLELFQRAREKTRKERTPPFSRQRGTFQGPPTFP